MKPEAQLIARSPHHANLRLLWPLLAAAIYILHCQRGEESSGVDYQNTGAGLEVLAKSEAEVEPAPLGEQVGERPAGVFEDSPYDAVILTMGADQVTYGQIVEHLQRRRLLMGLPSEDLSRLEVSRDPHTLFQHADTILQEIQLLREGERLELLPDAATIEAAWESHPTLSVFHRIPPEDLEAQLASLELERSDLLQLILFEIVYQRWLQLVVEMVSEEQLAEEYRYRNDTISFDLVSVPNVPTNREIEAFLQNLPNEDWVEQVYQFEQHRFMEPEMVDVRIVRARLPEDASSTQRQQARERLLRLREQVLAGADMVQMSLLDSEDPASRSGGIMYGVRARQMPEVFSLEPFEVSPILEDPWGLYFARVEERRARALRPLDEILAREIVATHLAREVPLPGPRLLAQGMTALLSEGREEALDELVRSNHLVRRSIGPLRRDPEGMIAGIGISPRLRDDMFALSPEDPVLVEPAFVDGSFHVVRVTNRQHATREAYLRDREVFEAEYLELVRDTAWDDFWQLRRQANPVSVTLPEEREHW